MGLDYSALFSKVQELVVYDRPASACMAEIIAVCSQHVPHPDWPRFSVIDYDRDVVSLTPWIANVFKKQPAPFQIQGLWVGLCNPCDNGTVWADMYLGSSAQYSPDDEELSWLWKGERHYPEDAYAHSTALRDIYTIAYSAGGLGNDAEWPLCLAFAAVAVRTLLQGKNTGLVGSAAPRIGVAVGFDGGDMLKIGELTEKEFRRG